MINHEKVFKHNWKKDSYISLPFVPLSFLSPKLKRDLPEIVFCSPNLPSAMSEKVVCDHNLSTMVVDPA